MRKLFAILAAGALLTTGGPAKAVLVPVTATLSLAIQGLAPIVITNTGSVDVTGGVVTVTSGLIMLTSPLVIPVTGTTATLSLTSTALSNQSGTFSPSGVTNMAAGELCGLTLPAGTACNGGGGLGGVMGLSGIVRVHVNKAVVVPVNLNDALIGQGGATGTPFIFDAAVWSTGTALVNTGVNIASTVGTGGLPLPITLVTPTYVSALGNLLPIFTRLTLTPLVPEPGSLLLIGTGVAGLALLGSRRKK